MQTISSILPFIQIGLAVLLTVSILLQQNEASAGAAFGGGDIPSGWRTRRGFERVLFIATIIIAILFVASTVLALVIQ